MRSSKSHAHSNTLQPTTRVGGTILLALALATLATLLFPSAAHATLSTGVVQDPVPLSSCPGSGWFSYTSGSTTHLMNCVAAGLAGCPNIQNLGFTYGYLSPSGITGNKVNGVIVYFDGGDGTLPAAETSELDMMEYYFQQGYEIVQVAWSSAWEATANPFPLGTYGNIQNAACRPATFLNYVYTNIFQGVFQSNSQAGMCAQGFSAGSAQVAYSLAYYGAGSYLDNVELISGPVFSDIKQGCQEPQPQQITVCPSGQYGCQLGTGGSPWTLSPTYVKGDNGAVGSWTNDNTCAIPNTTTSSASNARWLAQSIVDQGTGGTPTFSYPGTAMAGWLCRRVHDQLQDCSGNNFNFHYCPNNTSPQGEIFYSQITSSNSPPVYNVYAVDNCNGPEGVPLGNVGSLTGPSGETSIEQDMAGAPPNIPAKCVHRVH